MGVFVLKSVDESHQRRRIITKGMASIPPAECELPSNGSDASRLEQRRESFISADTETLADSISPVFHAIDRHFSRQRPPVENEKGRAYNIDTDGRRGEKKGKQEKGARIDDRRCPAHIPIGYEF